MNPPGYFTPGENVALTVRFERDLESVYMLSPQRGNVVVEGGRYLSVRRPRQNQDLEFLLTFEPDAGASQMVVRLVPGGPPYTRCESGVRTRICSSEGHPLTEEALHTLKDNTTLLKLNVDPIAGDDTVNIAEKAAGFAIAGDTGAQGGVSVTVQVGAETLTATSSTGDPAAWSVSVPGGAAYIAGTSVDVTVSASKTDFTAPADVARTLTVDLRAPTAPAYTAPSALQVGETIAAIDPSGGAGIDAYGATGLPSGLAIDSSTGAITGTPDAASSRTAAVTVTVSDAAGNTRRHGGHRVPGGGQGRPDARRVRLQHLFGHPRFGRADADRAERGADRPELLGRPERRVHRGRGHRRADPGGRRHLHGHRHGRLGQQLEPGERGVRAHRQ